jgi:hypothetical protein
MMSLSKIRFLMPLVWSGVLAVSLASLAMAQQRFTLTSQEEGIQSQAKMDRDRLIIVDNRGNVSEYRRDGRSDPAGGQWQAYFSQSAGQFLLWPTSNRGNFLIGDVDRSGGVQYRQSRMVIQPEVASGRDTRNDRSNRQPATDDPRPQNSLKDRLQAEEQAALGIPGELFSRLARRQPVGDPGMFRLAVQDRDGVERVLTERAGQFLGLPEGRSNPTDWTIIDHGQGIFELQTLRGSEVMALGIDERRNLMLVQTRVAINHLWRTVHFGGTAGYLFESVYYPGYCLALTDNYTLFLDAIGSGSFQLWMPYEVPAVIWPEPVIRSVTTQVVLDPPLPPARLELFNSHRSAIRILLADRRPGGVVTELTIAPNNSETISIERAPGARLIESREIRNGFGQWIQETVEFRIPPERIYDLSVYEEFLQSIAIDRTGKSPSPIEDVNYVPRSVGFLLIPSGDALPETTRWDLYRMALAADNPGAVRRFDPRAFDPRAFDRRGSDPLEKILDSLR